MKEALEAALIITVVIIGWALLPRVFKRDLGSLPETGHLPEADSQERCCQFWLGYFALLLREPKTQV